MAGNNTANLSFRQPVVAATSSRPAVASREKSVHTGTHAAGADLAQVTPHDPIVWLTFALVCATFGLWRATYKLWSATVQLAQDAKTSGEVQAGKMERSIDEASKSTAAIGQAAEAMHAVAVQAKNANEIAQASLASNQRAWLSIVPTLTKPFTPYDAQGGAAVGSELQVVVTNHGPSPASNVMVNAEVFYEYAGGHVDQKINEWLDKSKAGSGSAGDVVFPTQSQVFPHNIGMFRADAEDPTKRIVDGFIAVKLVVVVTYTSPHIEGYCQTFSALQLVVIKPGKTTPFMIDTSLEEWWEQNIVIMGAYSNGAT